MKKFLMVLLSIAFVLNLAIVIKRQKIFCNSVKRQNFTQRIAVIVVLCYNEQRRRINCA